MPPVPTLDRHVRHVELPVRAPTDPAYLSLALAASRGSLSLYVGAGVSLGTPSLLPTSYELLERLAPIVSRELGIAIPISGACGTGETPPAEATLELLADQADEAGQLGAFREIAADIAEFRDAPANYSHHVMAGLLREGAATVFSVNWDRCIERGAAALGFPLSPTVTEQDRSRRFGGARFHKIHGCAAHPETLLITSRDLCSPPPWVEHEVGAAVGASPIVFVGLGTVGGYVPKRVGQVLENLTEQAIVWLADPFPGDTWSQLLERAADRILEVDANTFFDSLLRACVGHAFVQLLDAATALAEQCAGSSIAVACQGLVEALSDRTALEVVSWLRAGAGGVSDGSPFLHSSHCRTALLAAALVSGTDGFRTAGERERLVLSAGTAAIELAVWPEARADVMVRRETARIDDRIDRGCYPGLSPTICHVCVGYRGPLPRSDAPADITGGDSLDGDILDSVPIHRWISAESLVQDGGGPVS